MMVEDEGPVDVGKGQESLCVDIGMSPRLRIRLPSSRAQLHPIFSGITIRTTVRTQMDGLLPNPAAPLTGNRFAVCPSRRLVSGGLNGERHQHINATGNSLKVSLFERAWAYALVWG
jgi:hypothetical protein